MKDLNKTVKKEINEYKKNYGDEWYLAYFNNFRDCLPGGMFRTSLTFSEHIKSTKYKDLIERLHDKYNYSELMLNQSINDFHETIDKVIKDLKINPKKIIKAQEEYKNHHSAKLYDLVIPIYIRLREMGYKRYPDLTA